MTSGKSGFVFALALAALGLSAPAAQAQSVPYWTTTAGFGSALNFDQSTNAFGNFSSRYNFENGWFVGSQRGNLGFGSSGFVNSGFGANSFTPISSFGSAASFSYEGAQVGYNFKSAPVSIYAGLDTLKYNTAPIVGSPFSALDSSSANVPGGYRVNAGVEFRPTSNLSLSVGASFSQQPSDPNAALLPGASPFGFRGR